LKFKIILIIFFLFTNLSFVKADWLSNFIGKKENDTVKIYIDKIIIFGNDVTADVVIRREIATKEESYLNIEIFKDDINRLYNLGLFNKIDVELLPIGDNKFNLLFTVEETFYILPVPLFNIKESDFSKIQVGANILWRNFNGLNQTLGLSFAVGYEPFISAYYFNPWLGKNNHLFTSFNLKYCKSVNKSITNIDSLDYIHDKSDIANFDNIFFSADFSIGRYFSKYFSLSATLGYNAISVSEYRPGRTVSISGKDKYMTLSLNANYDRRDNIFYTTDGSFYNAKYTRYNSFNNEIGFNKISLDLRNIVPIKLSKDYKISLASRILYSLPFGGNVPVYLHDVMGYDNLVRGWNGKVFDGEYLLCSFNEIRIPIIKPFFVNGGNHLFIKGLPVLKGLSYRYGLYVSPFFDVGGVWNKIDDFNKTQFRCGYGIGLDMILPFNLVGRVDFALRNENSKYHSQFIFFLNSSF
jgi:outer membrane protein insertion porin family